MELIKSRLVSNSKHSVWQNSEREQTVEDVWDRAEHGYADNDGTRIHYVTLGEGEPVVFVHGFPDFWYSWRHQMKALAPHF